MAFPFLHHSNFEVGTNAEWDSETDTNAKLSVAHYSTLANIPGVPAPYRGAYCAFIDLSGGTADAYFQEDDNFDTAAAGTIHVRFMLYLSRNLTMATTDEFIIFKLQSAGPTDEAVIAINYTTANGFRIGVGETAATQFLPISLGQWHTVELQALIDSGAGNDGTLTLWLDGSQATAVTALDQGAIIQARLGTMGIDSGTTAGYVLFDQVMADDARLFPATIRFPQDVLLTKSGHVFVGQGTIENVSLLSGGATDNVLQVFDTDVANTNNASNMKVELKNTVASELIDPAGMPTVVQRGCYVVLSGTAPRALVKIGNAQGYWSDGRIKQHGARRIPTPANW